MKHIIGSPQIDDAWKWAAQAVVKEKKPRRFNQVCMKKILMMIQQGRKKREKILRK